MPLKALCSQFEGKNVVCCSLLSPRCSCYGRHRCCCPFFFSLKLCPGELPRPNNWPRRAHTLRAETNTVGGRFQLAKYSVLILYPDGKINVVDLTAPFMGASELIPSQIKGKSFTPKSQACRRTQAEDVRLVFLFLLSLKISQIEKIQVFWLGRYQNIFYNVSFLFSLATPRQ